MLFATLLLAVGGHALSSGFEDSLDLEPKALILGIDGFRPEVLETTNTPNLDELMREGCFTFEALSDEYTISGAGWSNLLTGVWSDKHGVTDNEFKAPRYDRYPHVFDNLARGGSTLACAQYCSWEPIDVHVLGDAKIATRFFHDYKDRGDERLVARAVDDLGQKDLDFVFVYFADLDETGHRFGFHRTVPEYRAAIETIDAQIGELRAAIASRPQRDSEDWLLFVVSDHGGTLDRTHGRNIEEHRRFPFIISGRAAARGRIVEPVSQADLLPTALLHLGVEPPAEWALDGRAIGLRRLERGTILGRNLIENPGAEANGGLDTADANCTLTAFADLGAFTSVRYSAPGGFPSEASPGSKTRGNHFFCGGAADRSSIEQRIDLSRAADAIDAGAIAYELSAWLGGFAHQRDLAWVELEFENESGAVIGSARLEPVTLEDRVAAFGLPAPPPQSDAEIDASRFAHLTGFLQRSLRGTPPKGSRRVLLKLRAETGAGTCDGYADDLSFVLSRQTARNDHAEVANTLLRLLEADNAGDLEGIVARYSDDIVLMPPNSAPLSGKPIVRERYRSILAASALKLRAEIDELKVDGDTAWIRGTTLGETVPKDGGAARPVRDNFLMLMRREADEWRITRLMWHAKP